VRVDLGDGDDRGIAGSLPYGSLHQYGPQSPPPQDTVEADVGDVVAPDCETVDRGANVPGPAIAPARVKLRVAGKPRLASALRRGLTVRVTGAPAGRPMLKAT
jgi:hypothetical protein